MTTTQFTTYLKENFMQLYYFLSEEEYDMRFKDIEKMMPFSKDKSVHIVRTMHGDVPKIEEIAETAISVNNVIFFKAHPESGIIPFRLDSEISKDETKIFFAWEIKNG